MWEWRVGRQGPGPGSFELQAGRELNGAHTDSSSKGVLQEKRESSSRPRLTAGLRLRLQTPHVTKAEFLYGGRALVWL